jgi:GR25 family glycosyltransferase involved in LPS biosynthesis
MGLTNWEFLDAIDGNKLNVPQMKRAGDFVSIRPGVWMSRGELGCVMSHRAAWQAALDRGYQSAMFCEDDVLFRRMINKWVDRHWNEFPKDWGCIHWYTGIPTRQKHRKNKRRKRITDGVWLGHREGCGAVCYSLSRPAMEMLVEFSTPLKNVTDGVIPSLGTDRAGSKSLAIKPYLTNPTMVTYKRHVPSDIACRGVRAHVIRDQLVRRGRLKR